MVYVPVPNTVKVALKGRIYDQLTINTLYFTSSSDIDADAMEVLVGDLFDWWSATMAPQTSNQFTLAGADCTDLSNDSAPSLELSPTTTTTGTYAGPSLPANATWSVKFTTQFRGRSFRGRNYVPAIPRDLAVENNVLVSWADAVTAAYNTMPGSISDPRWTWVVVSRYSNKQPRATGVVTPVREAVYADLRIDSQRRRLTGRGI